MAITALQLKAVVTADTSEAEKGLKGIKAAADSAGGESGGGGIKGFLQHVGEMTTSLGIFSAVKTGLGFVVDQVKDSIVAAQQYQLVQAQTNAVLKSTGDASGMTAKGIADLAEQLSTVTPFSRDATQAAANMLLTFTNIKGNLPDVTKTTLDFATAMHMDATSAALQLGKALNDPATGYTKLQREGVTFSKAQVEQIKSMEKAGNMAGAQSVMLKELQREFGGSATAAGSTFAGSLQIVQNQLEDTKEKIGAALLPILAQLLSALGPLMAGFASFVGTALGGLSSFLTGTLLPLLARWEPVLGTILGAVQTLGSVFLSSLKPALDQIGASFGKLGGPGLSVKQVMGDIGKVVQFLVPYFAQAGAVVGQLASLFVTNVLPVLLRFYGFVAQNILPVLGTLAGFIIGQVVPVVMQLVGFFVKSVLPVFIQIEQIIIGNVVPALLSIVQAIITAVWPSLKQLIGSLEQLWNKLSPIIIPVLKLLGWILQNVIAPVIVHVVVPALGFLISIIVDVISMIVNIIGWLVNLGGVFTGIGTIAGQIWAGIGQAFKGGINGVIDVINTFIKALDSIQIHIPAIGVGPLKTPALDWNGLNIPAIPALAVGGVITSPGDVLVGEEGPERLSLPAGASVAPLPTGGLGNGGNGGANSGAPMTIIIPLDGRVIAQIVTKYQPGVVRQATGARAF